MKAALPVPALSLRRLAGTGLLLAIVAFLSGAAATAGGALVARAAVERTRIPAEARYYAIVRSALAEAAEGALAALPGVVVSGQRALSDLIPPAATGGPPPDRLRAIELVVALPALQDDLALTVDAIGSVDGVVDVVDRNAAERAAHTPAAARRWLLAGVLLALVGCATFVLGVARAAAVAVRDAGEELEARVLLGEDPPRLWMPFGLWLGAAACLGVSAAVGGLIAAARWLGPLREGAALAERTPGWPWLVAAGWVALACGASAIAAWSARRSVERLSLGRRRVPGREAAAAALALLALAAGPVRAAEHPADPAHLRVLNRDLAVARRALHQAERSLLGSEHRAILAAAAGNLVAVRLAAAQLDVDARQVERWRASRDTLLALRADLRSLRRAELSPGPPIGPRVRPVRGTLATGFRRNGERGAQRGFQNGIALRTNPGEVIRAVAGGRVAYAAELAGAGPIVVLSHGRRTYTVYGRVAELLVARGMVVEPGEAIARAPDQAGLLYFAVRERNRAVDPVDWLRGEDGGEEAARGG